MNGEKRTGFVSHPTYVEHRTGPGHPERPQRLEAILTGLERSGVLAEVDRHEPGPIDLERITAVHDPDHVARVEAACGRAPALLDGGDTAVSERSFEAARLAAGGLVEAVDRAMDGTWARAFVCCRPPGHHAERDRAMGFCLFNNVAVAAAHLRAAHGLERIAILDWDVHHGNGTQHLFEEDPGVFYASLHQWPLYPGTGAAEERGRGAGEGATLNCPLSPGTGDAEWLGAVEERVLPELQAFAPQFVLISAGFDAHRHDPLAAIELSEEAYREMTRRMLELAAGACGGRLVSVLEGGYDLEALAASVEAHLGELLRAG